MSCCPVCSGIHCKPAATTTQWWCGFLKIWTLAFTLVGPALSPTNHLPIAEPQVLPLSWQDYVQEFCRDMEVKTVTGYLIVRLHSYTVPAILQSLLLEVQSVTQSPDPPPLPPSLPVRIQMVFKAVLFEFLIPVIHACSFTPCAGCLFPVTLNCWWCDPCTRSSCTIWGLI